MVGLVIATMMVAVAIVGPYVAPHEPGKQFSGQRLSPSGSEFLLGTDNVGRDELSRLLYGARASIGTAAAATAVVALIGIVVGAWLGFVGGFLDNLGMRIVDILLAFPALLLALAVVGILGPGLRNAVIGATMLAWAEYARLVRGLVLAERERPYVQASIGLGAGKVTVIFRHIIPNIISPVIVLASLQMGALILVIAGLGFLGLGAQPPTAEWGAMLNQGRVYFQLEPQLMIYPGLAISITVLGFNLLGDGLRDILDVRYIAR